MGPTALGENTVRTGRIVADPDAPPANPNRTDYGLLLGATYALTPFIALATGGGLFELTRNDEIAVFGGLSMSLLPAAVHMAHGNVEHGALSFISMVGVTGASLLAGGLIGGIISSSTCESDSSDGCDFSALGGIIYGSLIGGVLGYTGYAIYDVSTNAWVETPSDPGEQQSSTSLGFWVRPLPAARAVGADTARGFDGVMIGAALQM